MLEITFPGLPWWYSGEESECQCRRHSLDPWSGNIPHATRQISLYATIIEACALEPPFCNC